jgi:hypothetical protein
MSHPLTILQTLDRHLTRPTRLILYGRAALALGFPSSLPAFSATYDVDCILPLLEMNRIEADQQFWEALELTNTALHCSGLYITHLFSDDQVILSPDWLHHILPISCPGLAWLQPFRPSTADLILTKMMRIDPQDREDIAFLLARLEISRTALKPILDQAVIPDVPEIREAFQSNFNWILDKMI